MSHFDRKVALRTAIFPYSFPSQDGVPFKSGRRPEKEFSIRGIPAFGSLWTYMLAKTRNRRVAMPPEIISNDFWVWGN